MAGRTRISRRLLRFDGQDTNGLDAGGLDAGSLDAGAGQCGPHRLRTGPVLARSAHEAESGAQPQHLSANLSPDKAGASATALQFRLRTLLGLVAAAAALSAVMASIGPLWSMLLVFSGLLVAGHVAGNACGTRGANSAPCRTQALFGSARVGIKLRTTLLRERHGPGPLMMVGIAIGAVIGGLLGTTILWAVYWGPFGPGPVGVGGASSAVVGGFLGFLTASFIGIAARVWHEASVELRRR